MVSGTYVQAGAYERREAASGTGIKEILDVVYLIFHSSTRIWTCVTLLTLCYNCTLLGVKLLMVIVQ